MCNEACTIVALPQRSTTAYFLTARKCGIFGICCEAVPRQVSSNFCKLNNVPQVNYLIDETLPVVSAERVAGALNRWASEGLDMMGGADGTALDYLLDEFLQDGRELPVCKLYEYSITFNKRL